MLTFLTILTISNCFYKTVLWNLLLDSEVIFAVVFFSLCSDFLPWQYIIITCEALKTKISPSAASQTCRIGCLGMLIFKKHC